MSVIFGLDELYGNEIPLIRNIKKAVVKFPNIEDRIAESISRGQIQSKLWLIEELNHIQRTTKKEQTIFIEAGWYGILAYLLFEKATFPIEKIRSFDIDSQCAPIADTINKNHILNNWKFKASTKDILQLNYDPYCIYETLRNDGSSVQLTDKPTIIINTSCEHIENFHMWFDTLPKGVLLVLQSNNLIHPEHVNRTETLEDFKKQCPKLNIFFEGELNVEQTDYTRFMLIGYI